MAKLRAIQKIVRQGNSAMVTLPRQICMTQNIMPGDFVEIETFDGFTTIRPWSTRSNVNHQSPGVIPERPEIPPKP